MGLVVLACAHAADPARTGREALARGNESEAARWLTVAVNDDPDDAGLWRDLARAQLRSGQAPAAMDAVSHAARLAPYEPNIVLLRGQIALALDDRDQAGADASAAVGRLQDPARLQELAVLFVRLGRAEQALAAARTAVVRSGHDPAAYTNLAVLAFELRRPRDAAAALGEGLRRHPDDLDLAGAQAAFLSASGQIEAARTAYRQLLGRHRAPELCHLALALLAHQAADLDDAREHAQRAVTLTRRRRADALYTWVVILRDRGETELARAEWERASRAFPRDADLAALEPSLPR